MCASLLQFFCRKKNLFLYFADILNKRAIGINASALRAYEYKGYLDDKKN